MTNAARRAGLVALIAAALALLPGIDSAEAQSEREDLELRLQVIEKEMTTKREELQTELMRLEMMLETAKRFLPAEFDPAQEQGALEGLAGKSELKGIETHVLPESERVALANGSPSPFVLHRIELSGRDEYPDVLIFLRRVARRPRAVFLEDLRLAAEADGAVSLAARLALPVYAGPVAPAPARQRPPVLGNARDARSALAQYFAAREALARQRVAELRASADSAREAFNTAAHLIQGSKADRVANALGALAREAGEEAVALTDVRVGGGGAISLTGVVQGEAARAALKPALERARFEVGEVKLTASGDCQAFSVTTRLKKPDDTEDLFAEPEMETGVRNGLFEGRTAAACRPLAHPVMGRVTAGPAPTGDSALLRLRDADVVDAVRVLHELTLQSFVVDSDVKGRIDLDLDGRASVEQVLDAMKSAGVVVGPGPLHRVSRAPAAAPAAAPRTYTGEPVTLSLVDADLLDVLRIFGEVGGLDLRIAPGITGRVTVFAHETPWDLALDGIAASAGVTAVVKDDQLSVAPIAAGRKTPARGPAGDAEPSSRPRWKTFTSLESLGPEDLALSGRSVVGGEWTAYAYGPGRRLWSLKKDVKLFGARVSSVGARGVELQSDTRGTITLPFPK